ncbi:hypothetical protein PIB30_063226 [Stylosanthes scabra]|uniref:Cytochrome P450 n=1 Tax=Stylosanthes scabra TaxID=79078 RepID=A0ABU6SMS1_9FABA|nr:hypothetical protein [Stylosanthes scabra]
MALTFLTQLSYEENKTLYTTILFGIIITIFLVVLNLIITRKRNKNNFPPCPPKLPFIGNLHQLGALPHRSFHELSKKHGPLMLLKLGQVPTLVVSSADVAREITKNHDVVFSDRPQATAANIFVYGCKDVGFAPYGEEWRQKRRVCVLELLSVKRVRSFQSVREQEVAELVGLISEMNAIFVAFDSFLEDVIEEHRRRIKNKEEKEDKDFVDILIELQENNMLEFEGTQDNLKAILVDMFVGGSDTTSTTLMDFC